MKKSIYNIFIFLAAALAIVSCSKVEVMEDYIKLSLLSYTFECEETSTLEINVESNQEWEFSSYTEDGEWLEILKNENGLSITPLENTEVECRFAVVTVKVGEISKEINLSQTGVSFKGELVDFGFSKGAMSRNGKWIAGVEVTLDDNGTITRIPVIYNTETGEETRWDPVEWYNEVTCISNDGTKIVLTQSGNLYCAYYENGEKVDLQLPEFAKYFYVEDMSAEGDILVGYYADINYFHYPVKWIHGEMEVLEVPELNSMSEKLRSGIMARGCSEDASVIFGSEWDFQGVACWVDGKLDYPGLDYAEVKAELDFPVRTFKMFAPTSRHCSQNGRYITSYTDRFQASELLTYYDTENMTITQVENCPNYTGMTVDKDIIFTSWPIIEMQEGGVYDIESGKSYTISDWFSQMYGIDISNFRVVTEVSSDGRTYYGLRAVRSPLGPTTYRSWYIRLD